MEQTQYPSTPLPPGPSTRRDWLLMASICLLAAMAYLPCLGGPFIWDGDAITKNALLRSGRGLADIWLNPSLNADEAHYWPVTYTVLWAGFQLWGQHTLGYHLLNLALHLINTVLVWVLLRKLHARAALLGAALFAIHPVHVEAVAWIIQTKELLATGFALFSAWCFAIAMSNRIAGERPVGVPLALCTLGYCLAILSKSSALPLPLCLGLICWWKRSHWRSGWIVIGLMLLGGLAAGLADMQFSRREALPPEQPLWERGFIALQAVGFYVRRLLFPFAVRPLFPPLVPSLWQAMCSVLIVAFACAIWHWRRRRGAMASVACYGVLLAPTLGLISFGFHKFTNVADRFQYAASVPGLALLAAGLVAGGDRLPSRRVRWIAGSALVFLLGSITARQARLWSDDLVFWEAASKSHPSNAEVANNFGWALDRARRYEDAEAAYRDAIRLDPHLARAHLNLGAALARLGRTNEAEASYEQALRLRPQLAEARNNLGLLYQQRGDTAAALTSFRGAVEADPAYLNARLNLAMLLLQTGQKSEAVQHLRQIISLEPRHTTARRILEQLDR